MNNTDIYSCNLVNLYELSFQGDRNARKLLGDILLFKVDYGGFTCFEDCYKAHDMLNKLKQALYLADISENYLNLELRYIENSYRIVNRMFNYYRRNFNLT